MSNALTYETTRRDIAGKVVTTRKQASLYGGVFLMIGAVLVLLIMIGSPVIVGTGVPVTVKVIAVVGILVVAAGTANAGSLFIHKVLEYQQNLVFLSRLH